jgi:hypothetical protein
LLEIIASLFKGCINYLINFMEQSLILNYDLNFLEQRVLVIGVSVTRVSIYV